MSKEVDMFLAHYGVPGMKWGKRQARTPEQTAKTKSNFKKGAIVLGSVAVAAGVAFVAYKMNKVGMSNIPVANLKTSTTASAGKSAFEKMVAFDTTSTPVSNLKSSFDPDSSQKMGQFLKDAQRNSQVIREQTARGRAQDDAMIGDIADMLRKAR